MGLRYEGEHGPEIPREQLPAGTQVPVRIHIPDDDTPKES